MRSLFDFIFIYRHFRKLNSDIFHSNRTRKIFFIKRKELQNTPLVNFPAHTRVLQNPSLKGPLKNQSHLTSSTVTAHIFFPAVAACTYTQGGREVDACVRAPTLESPDTNWNCQMQLPSESLRTVTIWSLLPRFPIDLSIFLRSIFIWLLKVRFIRDDWKVWTDISYWIVLEFFQNLLLFKVDCGVLLVSQETYINYKIDTRILSVRILLNEISDPIKIVLQ